MKAAQPFFDWLAEQAIAASQLNVTNNNRELHARFSFFLEAYQKKRHEADARKDEKIVKHGKTPDGGEWSTIEMPVWRLKAETRWLALATIESFFSWTEHIFIHIGILNGRVTTGADVARLAASEWSEKFRAAFDLSDTTSKNFYDQLLEIRRELRNFVAHGSFGKEGQAFKFHSRAGAVPVLLPHRTGNRTFTLGSGLDFDDAAALELVERFLKHLWEGPRGPAKHYIEADLPLILTMAADGSYRRAMSSSDEMEACVLHLLQERDRAANMDW